MGSFCPTCESHKLHWYEGHGGDRHNPPEPDGWMCDACCAWYSDDELNKALEGEEDEQEQEA